MVRPQTQHHPCNNLFDIALINHRLPVKVRELYSRRWFDLCTVYLYLTSVVCFGAKHFRPIELVNITVSGPVKKRHL